MKPMIILALAVVTLIPVGAQAPAGIDRVGWLQGCWALSNSYRVVEEQWMAPRAGTMLGMARSVRAGKLGSYEMTLIREQGTNLAFEAHPSDQPKATFVSSTVSTSAVVFENAAHDFPQRIGYERKGDSLLAWISGTQNGKTRRIEYPFTRVTCSR